MQERFIRVVKKYAIILGVGVTYLIFVLCTGLRIPCPFFSITGLYCPGCGITRMFVSIAKFDFRAAFMYNPYVLISLPFMIFCIIYWEWSFIKTGKGTLGKFNFIPKLLLVAALAFWVLRNVL